MVRLDEARERLDRVTIESLDFEECIKKYDSKETVFYCDPPYSTGCGYDGFSFTAQDHKRLRKALGEIKGKFILSYDDSAFINKLYKGFQIDHFSRRHGLNNQAGSIKKIFKEVIITKFKKNNLSAFA